MINYLSKVKDLASPSIDLKSIKYRERTILELAY